MRARILISTLMIILLVPVASASVQIEPSSASVLLKQGQSRDLNFFVKNVGNTTVSCQVLFSGNYSYFSPEILQYNIGRREPVLRPSMIVIDSGQVAQVLFRLYVPANFSEGKYNYSINWQISNSSFYSTPVFVEVKSNRLIVTDAVLKVLSPVYLKLYLRQNCATAADYTKSEGFCFDSRINLTIPYFGAVLAIVIFFVLMLILRIFGVGFVKRLLVSFILMIIIINLMVKIW